MHAVVLAGGGGTRLWPLSRRARPKPFLPLLGEESLFQRTLRRIAPLIAADDTWSWPSSATWRWSPNRRRSCCRGISSGSRSGATRPRPLPLRPPPRSGRADDVMVVLPADHHIAEEAHFRELPCHRCRSRRRRLVRHAGHHAHRTRRPATATSSAPDEPEAPTRPHASVRGRALRREAGARAGLGALGGPARSVVERRHLRLARGRAA